MPSFQSMFFASKGKPISYMGKTLVLIDEFPLNGSRTIRVVFEATGGKYRQGIALNYDGSFRVNDQLIKGKGGLVLWRNTAPDEVCIDLVGTTNAVLVSNAWATKDGTVHARHNGAAMIVELLPNGRRYRCNDGLPDDDFDDLIFRVESDSQFNNSGVAS